MCEFYVICLCTYKACGKSNWYIFKVEKRKRKRRKKNCVYLNEYIRRNRYDLKYIPIMCMYSCLKPIELYWHGRCIRWLLLLALFYSYLRQRSVTIITPGIYNLIFTTLYYVLGIMLSIWNQACMYAFVWKYINFEIQLFLEKITVLVLFYKSVYNMRYDI